MSDTRLNIAILLAATALIAIMSPPVWPAETQGTWSEGAPSCGVANEQVGAPAIRDLDPSEVAFLFPAR